MLPLRAWVLPAVVLLASGCSGGCGESKHGQRRVRDPARRAASRAVDPTPVRTLQVAVVGQLLAGKKSAAEVSLRRLRAAMLRLEQRVRRACRGPEGAPVQRLDSENRRACEALRQVAAINDELADRLDPGGPLAEQLDVMARLGQRFHQRLGAVGFREPPFSGPPVKVAVKDLPSAPGLAPGVHGPGTVLRCQPGPIRTLVSDRRGMTALAYGRLSGQPTLIWPQDCNLATPACARDRVWRVTLGKDGRPLEPPRDTGIDPRLLSAGPPLSLLEGPGGGLLLFQRDGDPWRLGLRPDGHPAGAPRPLWVRGEAWAHQAGTLWPRPAWLSTTARRPLDVRLFTKRFQPAAHVRLLGATDEGGQGLFGAPALLGTRTGFLVAFTTLRALFVGRLSRVGRPQAPVHRVPFARRGLFDPVCTVLARTPERRYVLTVGQRGPRHGEGLLVALAADGRLLRSPVALRLPRPARRGCPFALVPVPGRLLLLGLRPATPGSRDRILFQMELERDGRPVGRAVDHGPAEALVGAVRIADRVVVVWRGPPANEGVPGPVLGRAERCP